ncbi:MAG: HAMP domain-containing protein [Acidimicrobiales bacterium]
MRRVVRLRSSILLKSVVAILFALMVSTLVTEVATSRVTRRALANQSRELGNGQMSILQEAYDARERQLVINLRNLVQILVAQGFFGPEKRVDLIAEMGRASANLELDLLTTLDGRGRPLASPVSVGLELANPETLPRFVSDGLRSRLVRATNGTFVQAAALSAGEDLLVVGGYSFDDEFAYSLRKQVGSLDDVVLVASGEVVGSTLPLPPRRPPTPAAQEELPTSPARVDRSDFHGLVTYVHLGRTADLERGAIGLVLNDESSTELGSTLGRARLAATGVLAVVTLGLGFLLYRYLIRPLVRLAGTARRIAAGDLGATFDAPGQDEIGMLASSLEQMRIELRTKLDLIASQAEHLQRQATDLQESSQRIVAAEDNERHRLARDLHDGIQQELVVLRMRIGMATEGPQSHDGDRTVELEELGAELDATIERLREVTRNLYPSILLDRGLAVAIRSYIRRLPLNVHLTYASEPFPRLDPAVESGAYFLLCEALTNAFKHADCTDIAIALRVEGDWLAVSVQDDGVGFSPEGVRGRSGLLHMHDRVRSFGGELEIVSARGEGTSILARFPTRLPDDVDTSLPDPVVANDGADRAADAGFSPPPARERTGLPRPAG